MKNPGRIPKSLFQELSDESLEVFLKKILEEFLKESYNNVWRKENLGKAFQRISRGMFSRHKFFGSFGNICGIILKKTSRECTRYTSKEFLKNPFQEFLKESLAEFSGFFKKMFGEVLGLTF